MKILIVSANYPPSIGGPATTVPIIANELVKLGNTVDVLTQGVHKYKDKKESYNLIRVGKFSNERKNILQIIQIIKCLSQAIKELNKKNRYDLIHCHDLNISSLAAIISGVKNIKIAKFTGDLALEYYSKVKKDKTANFTTEEFYKKKTLLKNILLYMQKFISHKMNLILTPSNFIKNELITMTGIEEKKVLIFHNGASKNKFYNLKRNKNKLFCALKLEPKKNVKDAILSLKFLPKRYKLYIAGSGSEEKNLKKLSESENLKNRVKFLGLLPHKDVIHQMKTSFVFILPSVYEPASVSIYDAMSTGTPIVATKVGGTPEIIKNKKEGFLIKPFDAGEIAKYILKLNDKKLYKQIQSNQLKKIKEFYWNNLVKKELIPLYKKLIN